MPSLEVDTAGVRYVACPSPRADDPCIEPPSSQWLSLAPGVVIDHDTFYDTLGVPSAVDLGGGHVVRTTATTSDLRSRDPENEPARLLLGNAWLLHDSSGQHAAGVSTSAVVRFGPAGLVEVRSKANVPGLVPMFHAWQAPLGTTIRLLGADVPGGDFNTIAWDDGVDRDLGGDQTWNGVAQVASPGGKSCTPSMFSVDTAFDPAAWRAAGRTAEGLRVLVPVAVGNERSRAVRAWHEADSWTWDGDRSGRHGGRGLRGDGLRDRPGVPRRERAVRGRAPGRPAGARHDPHRGLPGLRVRRSRDARPHAKRGASHSARARVEGVSRQVRQTFHVKVPRSARPPHLDRVARGHGVRVQSRPQRWGRPRQPRAVRASAT